MRGKRACRPDERFHRIESFKPDECNGDIVLVPTGKKEARKHSAAYDSVQVSDGRPGTTVWNGGHRPADLIGTRPLG
jgi:hypothetical protein